MQNPHHILWEDKTRAYSLADINDISAWNYGYLRARGIGAEDVVMTYLPRSAAVLCSFYGILRAGACAVFVDFGAAEKYRDYFISDSKPKLTIDEVMWEEILKATPLDGWACADEHDAAVIIYTSSSTGEPKGAVHEYGDIDRLICYSFDYLAGDYDIPDDRTALVSELHDVATITTVLQTLYANAYIYVVDREDGRDAARYAHLIREKSLTTAYLMPHLTDLTLLSRLPSMRYLFVSFDVIHGVYLPGFPLYNTYGMSGSFCDAATVQEAFTAPRHSACSWNGYDQSAFRRACRDAGASCPGKNALHCPPARRDLCASASEIRGRGCTGRRKEKRGEKKSVARTIIYLSRVNS